jgi:hypothetical protein
MRGEPWFRLSAERQRVNLGVFAPVTVIQAVRPDLDTVPAARIRQKIEVEGIVSVLEKRPLAPVAALGHMVRDAGQDHAGEASHGSGCQPNGSASIWGFSHLSL